MWNLSFTKVGVCFVALIFAQMAKSQPLGGCNHVFLGSVLDLAEKTPVVGAKVTGDKNACGPSITDSDGNFALPMFDSVPVGTALQLRITAIGYIPFDKRIAFALNINTTFRIERDPDSVHVRDIPQVPQISAKLRPQPKQTVPTTKSHKPPAQKTEHLPLNGTSLKSGMSEQQAVGQKSVVAPAAEQQRQREFTVFGKSRKQPAQHFILCILVEGISTELIEKTKADYHGGLARLLRNGAYLSNGYADQFPTVGSTSYSIVSTGAMPSITGIIGDQWYERSEGQAVVSVEDSTTKLVGGYPLPDKTGASPRRLLTLTIGDQIKTAYGGRVFSVGLRNRAAVLLAGHEADAAYWFDNESSHFVSSNFYMQQLPVWVSKINAERPAFKYLGVSWMPLDATAGTKPFATLVPGTEIRYVPIENTPFANELIEEFAEHLIDFENLGKHDGVDILFVSFSANDYVGHMVGPDSPEMYDMTLRTDLLVGKLLDMVDARLGADRTIVVFASCHGMASLPETLNQRNFLAGRMDTAGISQMVEKHLETVFGTSANVKWIEWSSGNSIYLNYAMIHERKLSEHDVEEEAAHFVRTMPHVLRVYTGHDLSTGSVMKDKIGETVFNSFFTRRSPDLTIIFDPYYITALPPGTTHGSPFDYDTHVPILFAGPDIRPGEYRARVSLNDVAPTLAALLRVDPPAGSVGRAITEIIEHSYNMKKASGY